VHGPQEVLSHILTGKGSGIVQSFIFKSGCVICSSTLLVLLCSSRVHVSYCPQRLLCHALLKGPEGFLCCMVFRGLVSNVPGLEGSCIV